MRKVTAAILMLVLVASIFVFPLSASADSYTAYSITADGHLQSFSSNYTTAQGLHPVYIGGYPVGTDNLSTEYSTMGIKVGQTLDTLYYIWRGVLAFDTSFLPDDCQVDNVTLSFYGRTDSSDTDFNITVVEAGDVHSPLQATDFDVVYYGTTAIAGTLGTADFVTDDYNTVEFTEAGRGVINLTGHTAIALRSSRDIAGTTPAGDEYVEIWSGNSVLRPYLAITYSIPDLGDPDNIAVSNLNIYTNFLETDDQLYVFAAIVKYAVTPEVSPMEYYSVQLLDGEDVLAQTPLRRWGYAPLSIYLSADAAPTWGEEYTLTLAGTDKFDDPPSVSVTTTSATWKGSVGALTSLWCISRAKDMGNFNGLGEDGYLTSYAGTTLINDAGTGIFVEGIPYINAALPGTFSTSGTPAHTEVDTTDDHSGTLYALWGDTWMDAFDTLGGYLGGIPGQWILAILFTALSVAAVAVVRWRIPHQPTLSIVAAMPVILIGFLVGVPLLAVAFGGTICILLLGYNIFLRHT